MHAPISVVNDTSDGRFEVSEGRDLASLPPAVRDADASAFATSLSTVFTIAAAIALVAPCLHGCAQSGRAARR